MGSMEDFKKFLQEQEYNKQSINNVKPAQPISTFKNSGSVYQAEDAPDSGTLLDFVGSTVWNTLDSGLIGIPGIAAEKMGIDVPYSIENWEDMPTTGKYGGGVGQALGFYLPIGAIGKGIQYAIKGIKLGKAAITTAGKIDEVAALANTLTKKGGIITSEAAKGLDKVDIGKVINKSLKSKNIKPYLKNYEVSEDVIRGSKEAFNTELSSNIVNVVSDFGGKIDIKTAKELSSEIVNQLGKGGLHHNTLSQVFYKKFGGHLEDGMKRRLIGYTSQAAENMINFTLYNAATGLMQEMNNSKEFNYLQSMKDSALPAALFSLGAPFIDMVPGGKSSSITRDAMRITKLLFKKPHSKMATDEANALLRLYKRYDADGFKSMLSKTKNPATGKNYNSFSLDFDPLPDKVAQKLVKDYWTAGRRDLIKRFGTESRKDLVGSFGRMSADGVLFAGVNMMMDGSPLSRLGVEDTWVNMIIGAVMSKKKRPLPGSGQEQILHYTDGATGYGMKYDQQAELLNKLGMDLKDIETLIASHDASQYMITKGKAFAKNDNVNAVVNIFNKAVESAENNKEGNAENLSNYPTVRDAYDEVYRIHNMSTNSSANLNIDPLNLSKLSVDQLKQLEADLQKVQIGEIEGKGGVSEPLYLKGNITKLTHDALRSSSESILNDHLEAAIEMSNVFGFGAKQLDNGKFLFTQLTSPEKGDMNTEGLDAYHSTLAMLELYSDKIEIQSDANVRREDSPYHGISAEEMDSRNRAISEIVKKTTKKLAYEHYGMEDKALEWASNALMDEVRNSAKIKELEQLAQMNSNINTFDFQLESLANAFNEMEKNGSWHKQFNDGFVLTVKDENGNDRDILPGDGKDDSTQRALDFMYRIMSIGKKKRITRTDQRKKIDFDEAQRIAGAFQDKFKFLWKMEQNNPELIANSVEQYVLKKRFEGIEVSDANFALVKKITDENVFDIKRFPSQRATIEIITSQLRDQISAKLKDGENLEDTPDYKNAMKMVEALYTDVRQLKAVFTIDDNIEKVIKRFSDEDEIPYLEKISELAAFTNKYFIEDVQANLFKHLQVRTGSSEVLSKGLKTIGENIVKLGTDNSEDPLVDLRNIVTSLDEMLAQDGLTPKDIEILNSIKKDLSGDIDLLETNQGSIGLQLKGLENVTSEGQNKMDKLMSLITKRVEEKNGISKGLQNLILVGNSSSNREVALKAIHDVREFLVSRMAKDYSKQGVNPDTKNIYDLLEDYNKTGQYKEFKKLLDEQNYLNQRLWTNEEWKSWESEIGDNTLKMLDSIKDAMAHVSPDILVQTYLKPGSFLIDPENGRFSKKIISDLSSDVHKIRTSTGADLDRHRKALRDKLVAIRDEFLSSEKLSQDLSANRSFVKKELGPLVNTLVNTTNSPTLTWNDGQFQYKNKSRVYTPTDTYLDNMNGFLGKDGSPRLIEIDNSAWNGRAVNFNAIEDIDNILKGTRVGISSEVDDLKIVAEAGTLPLDWVNQDGTIKGNNQIIRIGISNYKTLGYVWSDDANINLHKTFKTWYDNKLESLKKRNKDTAEFEAIFSHMANREGDNAKISSGGEIKAALRAMYYDSINRELYDGLLTKGHRNLKGRDAGEVYAKRLKYLKYVHVIEGAMTSTLKDEAVQFLRDSQDNDTAFSKSFDSIYNRDPEKQIGVAVINDEMAGDNFLRNDLRVISALESARVAYEQNGQKDMAQQIATMIGSIKEGDKGDFASVGNMDNIVSLLNGITFIDSDVNNVISGVRGVDTGEASQGIKPVVRHNDFDWENIGAGDPSTLVMKTMMVYNKDIADAMQRHSDTEMGPNEKIHMVTFKSAAKAFSEEPLVPKFNNDEDIKSGYINTLKGYVDPFYISMEDIGVNYMTKDAHRAPMSPSLFSSMSEETVKVFQKWIGYDGEGNTIGKIANEFSILGTHNETAQVKALLAKMEQEGLSMDDPSIGTFHKLINAGLDANSPLVRYDVLKMLKNNFVDKIGRPLSEYGVTSPLVPDMFNNSKTLKFEDSSSLTNPVFDLASKTQSVYGGIKVGYNAINTAIKKSNKLSFIFRDDSGREHVVGKSFEVDKSGKLLITGNPYTLNKKTGAFVSTPDAEKHQETISFIKDLYTELAIDREGGDDTYLDVFTLLEEVKTKIANGETIDGRTPIRVNGKSYKITNVLANKIAKHNLGIGLSGLRIPKQSGSDFVINRVEGHFGKEEGNFVAVNALELATKHQGDFDVDKLFYYFDTPHEIMSSLNKKSAEVLDQGPILDDAIIDDFNLFQQDATSARAGAVEEDGISTHIKNISKASALLGRSVKLLSSIPTLENLDIKIAGNKLDFNNSVKQNIANLISSAVDHHGGVAKFIAEKSDRAIIKWALFGSGKDFPKVKGFKPVINYGKDKYPTKVHQDVLVESIMTVGKLSRVFSGVFDEGGGRTPELHEIKDIHDDVAKFYTNPGEYIFKKLFYKYQGEDRGNNSINHDQTNLIKTFFGGTETTNWSKDQFIKKIISGDMSGLTFYPEENAGITLIGMNERSLKAMFEKSPAGKVIHEFGIRDFSRTKESEGFDENINKSLSQIRQGLFFSRMLDTQENKDAFLTTSIGYKDDGPGEGLKVNLYDIKNRSALYQTLEIEINKLNSKLDYLEKDRFADQDKINQLLQEKLDLEAISLRIEKVLDENVLKNASITTLEKGQSRYNESTDKSIPVYMLKKGGSESRFADLEPIGRILPGETYINNKANKVVVLNNPIIEHNYFENDLIDGQAWFTAIDSGLSDFKLTDWYGPMLDEIDNMKFLFKERRKKTSELAKKNIGKNIWKLPKTKDSNELTNFIKKYLENLDPKDDGYPLRVEKILKALLRPKAVFGRTVKNTDASQLPMFVQDPAFTKHVLGHFLNSGDPIMSSTASELLNLQGELYREIKYGKIANKRAAATFDHINEQSKYFLDNFRYKEKGSDRVQESERMFLKDLLFNKFTIPASVIDKIHESTDFRDPDRYRIETIRDNAGNLYNQAVRKRESAKIDNLNGKNASLDNSIVDWSC